MKIAISATGPTLEDEVDPRFGRCPYFIIIDPDTMEFEALDNASAMGWRGRNLQRADNRQQRGRGSAHR